MSSIDLGIPGYTDLSEVDRGGFATIYRAWQPTFERPVAIKVLLGKADETTVRRFQRECAAIGALSGHPNIVTVYEAGTTGDGRLFLVMEFLPGGSLAHRLAEQGPFGVNEVLDVGVRVTGAIESAHRAGLLHRDIKPENILLSRLGEPKVADFGLAHAPGLDPTVSSGLTATILHAAPEVLAGEEPTVASDVYSVASTLYCLLSGGPAFARPGDPNLLAMLSRITDDPPPDLRPRGVPEPLWRVLEQGLAKEPAERQHDAAQLGRQLQAAQAAFGLPVTGLPIESVDQAHAPPVPTRRRSGTPPERRRRAVRRARLIVAALLGLGAVLSIVVPLVRGRPAPLPALYQDNFDAGQNWYEHDDEGAKLAYDDGRYRMLAKLPERLVLSDTSFRGGVYGEPLISLTDVSVRVRAEPVRPGTVFGVFCRYSSGSSYQAVLRSDGEALLLKVGPTDLTKLAGSSIAAIGMGAPVSLRLDCTGESTTRLTLYVDGRKVADGSDRDGLRSGTVGMLTGAEEFAGEAVFEDFVLFGKRQQA